MGNLILPILEVNSAIPLVHGIWKHRLELGGYLTGWGAFGVGSVDVGDWHVAVRAAAGVPAQARSAANNPGQELGSAPGEAPILLSAGI